MIMEYCNGGDLFQKITSYQKKGGSMEENDIWNVFTQITSGLKALHDQNIFHRDLKSANIFLMSDGRVVLGDMNVSKIAKKGLLYTQTGTPYYASPEVWKDQPYDSKSDIWSLGCVLYEMATLRPPFKADDMEGLFKKVVRGFYNKIPSHYSADLNSVIRATLQVSPQLRPSCAKILSMPGVLKHMGDQIVIPDEADQDLLKTIQWPRYVSFLTERLPKANYRKIQTKTVDKVRFVRTLGEKGTFPQNIGSSRRETHSEEPKTTLPTISKPSKPVPTQSAVQELGKDSNKRSFPVSNSPAPLKPNPSNMQTGAPKQLILGQNGVPSKNGTKDKSRYLSELLSESKQHLGGNSPSIRSKKGLPSGLKQISLVSPYIPESHAVNYSSNVGNPYSLNLNPVKVNYLSNHGSGGQHGSNTHHYRESSMPASSILDNSARARQLGLEVVSLNEKRGRTRLAPISNENY